MEGSKKSELQRTYDKLRELVLNMDPEIKKADLNGNKAAGRRARTALQQVKAEAQSLRKLILEKRE
jgi:hypothetical protein